MKAASLIQIKKELEKDQGSLLYQIMMQTGVYNSRNKNFQFWQQHNHPIQLDTPFIFNQKVGRNNPNKEYPKSN